MSARIRPLVFGQEFALPEGPLDLQEIVRHQHAAGIHYAKAKAKLERLDLERGPIKSRLMQRELDRLGGKISETRLMHWAESTPEYARHLELVAAAREDFELARIVYESLRALFEAKRSELSYAKAEMSIL